MQAPSQEAAKKLGDAVLAAVQGFGALDVTPLEKYVA